MTATEETTTDGAATEETTATDAALTEETTATDGGAADGEPTCFVVIGFGKKTDFATGRQLDLDKTYSKLIKPAFDAAGIRCFRAIDVNVSGSIDKLMYNWIYHADFVIADLSTMNANVFYELGVRHAQRPSTTLIMAENGIFKNLPFDLSHTIIYGYDHLGDDIAPAEVTRFTGLLSAQLDKLLAMPERHHDSPVYTYLQGMKAPTWTDPVELIAQLEAKLAARQEFEALDGDAEIAPEQVKDQSLSIIIDSAEAAKNRGDHTAAKALFNTAIESSMDGVGPGAAERDRKAAVDVFLWQRLALVTYKEYERDDDDDVAIAALRDAETILDEECDAQISTDPETLGLSGAVNKRLYDRIGDRRLFERSVGFYERGFYIKQDYYNGINAAFMYTVDAARLAEAGDRFQAIVSYGHADILRRKVADICLALIDAPGFAERDDREWVYQTLAQAYLGMGDDAAAEALMPKIAGLPGAEMDMSTFVDQNRKLVDAMDTFARLVGTDEAASVAGEPAPTAETDSVPRVLAESPLTIDLGALGDRPLRSVEVRVEFEQ